MRIGQHYRLLAVVATAVAAAALLASSPAEYSVSADPVSGRVTVSPQNPEVRIPFTATATEAALELGRIRIGVDVQTVWTGTPQTTIDRGVHVAIETTFGDAHGSASGGVACGVECLGSNELVIRWPLEEPNGKADVEWTISNNVDAGENAPPEDASLTVQATPSDPRPEPVAVHVGRLPIHGLLVTRISVDNTAAITDLALHHVGPLSSSTMLSVAEDDSWRDIPVQHGVPLQLPSECDDGPCTFEVLTAAKLGHPSYDSPFQYEVMATPGEEASVTATAEQIDPWSISASSPSLTVNLEADTERVLLPISSSLAAEIGTSPVGATVTVDPGKLNGKNGVAFTLVDSNLNLKDLMGRFRSGDSPQSLTEWFPITCSQSTCTLASNPAIEVSHANRDDPAPVEVDFAVTVEYVFPMPIAGAGMPTLEVGEPR